MSNEVSRNYYYWMGFSFFGGVIFYFLFKASRTSDNIWFLFDGEKHTEQNIGNGGTNQSYLDPNVTNQVFHNSSAYNSTNKIILFWTQFDKSGTSLWWEPSEGYEDFMKQNCAYQNCDFTDDKAEASVADLVLFKDDALTRDGLDWPSHRHPEQLYAHYICERPGPWHEYIRKYDGKINLTMNYRHNADIRILLKVLTPQKHPQELYKPRIPLKNKTKSVVWAVSHCNAASKRDVYVKELSKHIDVHIFGHCGNMTCSRKNRTACFAQWENDYKFYLSFENALCDDYLTEKFFLPTQYELIPVIFSGHIYDYQFHPHSYVNATNFISPKDLAAFLMQLGEDEELYYKYFDWKAQYKFGYPGKPLCGLCEAANTYKDKPARHDYYDWWFRKCDNGLVDRMRQRGGW